MPFKPPSSGFGKLPPQGGYIGELVGVIDGPIFKDFETGEPQPKMAWVFRLFTLTGDIFPDPESDPPGQQYIATTFTNETIAQKSTARGWFSNMLGRGISDGEDPEDLVKEALAPRSLLQFGMSTSGKTKLSAVVQFEGESTLDDAERERILATFPVERSDYSGAKQTDVKAVTATAAPPPPPKVDPATVQAAAEKAQAAAAAAASAAAAAE